MKTKLLVQSISSASYCVDFTMEKSWSDVVKGVSSSNQQKEVPIVHPLFQEEYDVTCARCGCVTDDIRYLRISYGGDFFRTNLRVLHGNQKWITTPTCDMIGTCKGCRGEFIDAIKKHWVFGEPKCPMTYMYDKVNNSDELNEREKWLNQFTEFSKCNRCDCNPSPMWTLYVSYACVFDWDKIEWYDGKYFDSRYNHHYLHERVLKYEPNSFLKKTVTLNNSERFVDTCDWHCYFMRTCTECRDAFLNVVYHEWWNGPIDESVCRD